MTKPWPAPGRIACEVPGCRRTFKSEWDGQRVICGRHWRTIPRWMRSRMTRLHRLWHKFHNEKAANVVDRWWDKCRDRAIEIAMGITA